MTRNEQVAKVMGWKHHNECFIISDKLFPLKNRYFFLYISKLLQQRMVDNGWEIEMTVNKSGFIFFAWRGENNNTDSIDKDDENTEIEFDEGDADTEPAAIFDLFCKVFNIKEEA